MWWKSGDWSGDRPCDKKSRDWKGKVKKKIKWGSELDRNKWVWEDLGLGFFKCVMSWTLSLTPTIIPPPHIESTPSYHIYPPAPVIPSLLENYQDTSLPPTPFLHPAPLESIISGGSELIGRTFQSFLPEHKYLATTIPTQSKKELNTFCSHCWYLLQGWQERHIEHLLLELTDLTPDPIVFSGYLWKYHTSVNNNGILENYWTI